ncbi:MAG: asparagine synthase-related protein, partial [Acidobacteriota bacterium]
FHDGSRFAFASDKRALLPLLRRPPTLDEDYVAEILIAWPAGHADKTPYREIRRLCPAHVLDADDSGARLRLYWSLDHVPDVRLRSREDYAEAALEILRRATASRLRSDRPTAISLSGGLDSAAVAAVAAPMLADRGASLTAFTSVPLYAVAPGRGLSGDEFHQAGLTAARFHNIEHVAVRAEGFSPVRGVREMLRTHGEPGIAPANQFWLNAINHAARDRRVGRLLSGQHGNGTISWAGLPGLASVAAQLRLGDPRRAGGEVLGIIRRWVAPVLSRPRASGSREASPWRAYSAVNPDLSARLRIGQRLAEADDAARTPRGRRGREERLRYIRPGVDMSGCRRAHVGAAFGFVAADPTRDVRLIELIQGMPDWVFRGEFDRHLARAMTSRLLPTEVRLQTAGGQQAADLLERLRHHADEQHELLAAISASPHACALIDVPYVESIHREVVSTARNDQVLLRQAQSVLMSGLAVGAFLRACDDAAAGGEVELSR